MPFFKKSKSSRVSGGKPDRGVIKSAERKYVAEHMDLDVETQSKNIIEANKKLIARQLERHSQYKDRAKGMKYFDEIAQFYDNSRYKEIKAFKEQGGKVIGTMCVFVPEELIIAANAIPVRLCSGFYEPVHPANELFGEVGLCPLVRSTLGCRMVKANPYFELCDVVFSPATCDGKLKLGETLSDYGEVLMVNLPRIKEGDVTRKQWYEEMKFIGRKLESITGTKITRKRIKYSIELYQRAHKAWYALNELRLNEKVPIWGRDAMLVAQTSFIDDMDRWTKQVEALTKELVQEKYEVNNPDDPRIMLGGSPIIWPNEKIPSLIEETGGIIVTDELCSSMRIFYNPVVVDEYTEDDMFRALAERYLYPCTCPCFSPNDERDNLIMNQIKKYKVDGVLFHVLRGCHLNSIEATRIDHLLRKNSISMLKLESEYDEGDIEQMLTRVEAFLEMIRVRKEMA